MSDHESIDEQFWAVVLHEPTTTPAATLARAASSDRSEWMQSEVDGALHMWVTSLPW